MTSHAPARPQGRVGGMIAVAAAAAFLATFNETFLNVAFTPIMEDFGVNVNTVQWLTTAYLLVAAVFVPVSNVLYHRFPTRPLVVAVAAIMVVGSIVGALAPSFGVLLAGRLLQAIGTGLLTPIGMNITLAVSPREKLGLNMGIMAAMTTLGPSLAIVLSGVLLSFVHWSTLMWVFAVLCLIVLCAAALLLRNVAELGRPVLDVLSFLLVAVGLVGVLYGVSTAFSGSLLWAVLAIVVGLIALALFVVRQNRIDNPLLNLAPFKSRSFVLGALMTMLGLLFVFAMNVTIPLFLQGAHGMAPLGASLALAPGILLTVLMGPVAGQLFDKHGGRWSIPLGFAVMAVFVAAVGWVAGGDAIWIFALLYIPAVLATSFVIGPSQTFGLSSLDRESSPHGVTVISTGFQIAGCVGTALAAGIYGAVSGGSTEFDALLSGFRGAVILVIITCVIGLILGVVAYRTRSQQSPSEVASSPERSVAAIMKTDVYALPATATALDAMQMFSERGISGAPVLNTDGTLAGFLSDGDILRYLSATYPSSVSLYSFAAGDKNDLEEAMASLAELNVMRIATPEVLTLNANESLLEAVETLSEANIKKVPVLDQDGAVVGIVSRSAIGRLAIGNYLRTREEALV